ncbi:hypothetical protein SESBI_33953 [Sesbania bispinosa]|nr:hypothetical protein SESBI_33953 [Sesbania bispinosa]
MAPTKNANKKTKSPKASVEKNKKGPIQKKKPSTSFKKKAAVQRVDNSKTIVLFDQASSQAPKTNRVSTSKKTSASHKAGPSSTTFDGNRFCSSDHAKHYHSDVKLRSIIPDRNIILNDDEYPEMITAISKLGWEFFCKIAGQGKQALTHEFYTNGWKAEHEDLAQFTTMVRGKVVKFDVDHINKILRTDKDYLNCDNSFDDFCAGRPNFKEMLRVLYYSEVVWLPLHQKKPRALKMGDLQPFARAWGAFIIASGMVINVGSIISKEMETIMSTKGVNISDDDVPIHAAKPISAKRIAEYELASTKKQSHASPSAQPSQPQRRSQAETLQLLLDNQAEIMSRQNILVQRQDVLYESLKNGQLILAKNLVDIPGRVHTETPFFVHYADLDDDALGEHLGHKELPPLPAIRQSQGVPNNDHDDGAQENDDNDGADA